MSTVEVSGTLTDVGADALADVMRLRLHVRPEEEAFSPDGLVSQVPVLVDVDSDGAFTMTLIPSGELTGRSGRAGVGYVISADRFEETADAETWVAGWDLWRFVAVAGGGNIGEMAGGSLLAVWIGPPIGTWPTAPYPKGLYIDPIAPNPWGVVQ